MKIKPGIRSNENAFEAWLRLLNFWVTLEPIVMSKK